MTETCIADAQQWIRRLRAELAELEACSDYREQLQLADDIREEIQRVEQAIAQTQTRREQVSA